MNPEDLTNAGMCVGLPALVLLVSTDESGVDALIGGPDGTTSLVPVHNWLALILQLQAISPEFH